MKGINTNLAGSYFSVCFSASSLIVEIVCCIFYQHITFTSSKPALPVMLQFHICKLLWLLCQVCQVLCSVMHLQLWVFRAAFWVLLSDISETICNTWFVHMEWKQVLHVVYFKQMLIFIQRNTFSFVTDVLIPCIAPSCKLRLLLISMHF